MRLLVRNSVSQPSALGSDQPNDDLAAELQSYTNLSALGVAASGDTSAALPVRRRACMATLHVVDYIMHNRDTNAKTADRKVSAFCEDASGRNFPFCVTRAFALASKHCCLSQQSFEGFHSGAHMVAYPSFAGVMRCGASFSGDTVGGITIHWKATQFVNLTNALKETLQFYEAEFPELTQEGAPVLCDYLEGG